MNAHAPVRRFGPRDAGRRRSSTQGTLPGTAPGATRGVACGLALLASLLAAACGGDEAARDPLAPVPDAHVVLISLDTLRADHLGAYGHARETSPHLDAFAAESLRFERCLAAANNTAPSHMTLMTGTLPAVHGIEHGKPSRPSSAVPMLADELRASGWRTWGLADGAFVTEAFGFDRGFDRFESELRPLRHKLPRLLGWIDEMAAPGSPPTFLFMHTYEAHAPYVPDVEYDLFTDDDYDGPLAERIALFRKSFAGEDTSYDMGALEASFWGKDRGAFDDADVAYVRALYEGDIRQTDAHVGRILDALRDAGLLDTAWVVITSDHGEAFREHGTLEHRQLYEEETHVPLLVRPPGGLTPGRTVASTARLLDVAPTILHAVGLVRPPVMQGRSLLPLDARFERPVHATAGEDSSFRAFIHGTRKVIRRGNTPPTFFDLAADPDERHALSGPGAPDWATDALSAMQALEDEAVALRRIVGEPGAVGGLSPERLAELIRLGYIDG